MDRRIFLMGTGVAAFAQSNRVATAVIGTGNRGSYLLKGVLEQPNARVVALCDLKADRLDKAASAAAKDNPATMKEWRKVIELKDVEAVYIATPPHLHAEMAVAAIQAGKHVYCEKPIGITAEQIRDIVKAARASKKIFVSGQQLRSNKQLAEAVSKIHEGTIGDLIMIKAQRHATADLPHDGSSGDWYFDVTKSGGYLIEQSVHNLDICNWVANAHPVKASGFGSIGMYKNQPPGRTIFDCSLLNYDYSNGVKMSFTQNVFHPRNMPSGGQYVHIFGNKGAVDLMYATTAYSLEDRAEGRAIATKGEEYAHEHTRAFYNAIQNGGKIPTDVAVGATAALTAIMGHEAMVKQKIVTWAEMGVDV